MQNSDYAKSPSSRYLDNLPVEKISRGLSLISPTPSDIQQLLDVAGQVIPTLASYEEVLRVYNHNPDSIMCIVRNYKNGNLDKPGAFVAQLPLNSDGKDALLGGQLDLASPQACYLTRQHEKVAAIYVWLLFLDSSTAGGIGLIVQRMNMPNYQSAPIFCKPIDPQGETFFRSLGFREYGHSGAGDTQNFLVYERQEPQSHDLFNTRVEVVHSIAAYQEVMAIRAATYIAEQDCPYAEEYDGNDFAASHLIGYCGDEPAGCIRVRFFANFAKVERLAVIKRFRRTRLAHDLIKAAKQMARKKGYTHLYGQAEQSIVKLWTRHGFVPRTQTPTVSFSGRNYIEGDLYMPPLNSAISAHSRPEIINRPEGSWDQPGVLERVTG